MDVLKMKFKTKKELEDKRFPMLPTNDEEWDHYETYGQGLDDAFKSFAERLEFYRKFSGFLDDDLTQEEKKIKKELVNKWFPDEFKIEYDDWLFHYCFDGVI
jgi:hypothetical protein